MYARANSMRSEGLECDEVPASTRAPVKVGGARDDAPAATAGLRRLVAVRWHGKRVWIRPSDLTLGSL